MTKPHFPKTPPPAIPSRFDAEEWDRLTSRERVRRCLLYADEAAQLGVHAPPDARQAYVDLSQRWSALAMEIEKNTGTG